MPTTELLVPPVIDDSKPVSPKIAPRVEPPNPPHKGILGASNRRKWLLAASVVVVIAIAITTTTLAASSHFRRFDAPKIPLCGGFGGSTRGAIFGLTGLESSITGGTSNSVVGMTPS